MWLHTCICRSKCTKICHKTPRFHSAQNSSLALLWVLGKDFLSFLTQFFPDHSPTHTPPSPAYMAFPMTSFQLSSARSLDRMPEVPTTWKCSLFSDLSGCHLFLRYHLFLCKSFRFIFYHDHLFNRLSCSVESMGLSNTHSELLVFSKKEDVIFDIYKLPSKCLNQTESKMSM